MLASCGDSCRADRETDHRDSCTFKLSAAHTSVRVSAEISDFWSDLGARERREILTVEKKKLFTRIREQFCSRCFGLFSARYDEIKGAEYLDCQACRAFYKGLRVSETGQIVVEDSILRTDPFELFEVGALRKRERDEQYSSADICGSAVSKKFAPNMCALHSSAIPCDALNSYWHDLPEEQKSAIVRLPEEDFASELDAALKFQLRVCKDCRVNVVQAYKNVKLKPHEAPSFDRGPMPICPGVELRVTNQFVSLAGKVSDEFFKQAENVEELKTFNFDAPLDDHEWRHAEDPKSAREALSDSVFVIFKGQIETAFREQTAGHNALLLFVTLVLQMMKEQLMNAFNDVSAKERGLELMDLEDKEKKREANKRERKRNRRANRAAQNGRVERSTAGVVGAAEPSPEPAGPSTPGPRPGTADSAGRRYSNLDSQLPGTEVPALRMPSYREACAKGNSQQEGNVDDGGWELKTNRRRATLTGQRRNSFAAEPASETSTPQHRRLQSSEGHVTDIPRSTNLAPGQKEGYMVRGIFVQPPPPPPPPRTPTVRKQIPPPPPPPKPAPARIQTQLDVKAPLTVVANSEKTPHSWTIGALAQKRNDDLNASPRALGTVDTDGEEILGWNPFQLWKKENTKVGLEGYWQQARRISAAALLVTPAKVEAEDSSESFEGKQHSFKDPLLNPFLSEEWCLRTSPFQQEAAALKSSPPVNGFTKGFSDQASEYDYDDWRVDPPHTIQQPVGRAHNGMAYASSREAFSLSSDTPGQCHSRRRSFSWNASEHEYSLFENSGIRPHVWLQQAALQHTF